MAVDAVQDAFVGGEVERDEREDRRERRGIELGIDAELVVRRAAGPSLKPCSCWKSAGLTYTSCDSSIDLISLSALSSSSVESAVNGDVDADVENLFLRLLELVAQTFEVLIGGVEHRVAHEAFFFAAS